MFVGAANKTLGFVLFQNHANIKLVDHEGRTALTYARAAASLATAQQQSQQHQSGSSSSASSSSTSVHPAAAAAAVSSTSPHYSVESTQALCDVLAALGCPEAPLQQQQQQLPTTTTSTSTLSLSIANGSSSGGGSMNSNSSTLPRRRETLSGALNFDKMLQPKQSSVI